MPVLPASVAAAFADPIAVGPWFAPSPPRTGGWQDARAVYDDDLALGALVGRLGTRLRTTEHRVAASLLHQGWAGRLFSISLGMAVRHGVVPDLSALQWRDEDGSVAVRLPRPAGREGTAADAVAQVVDEHLGLLVDGLQRLGPVAHGLLAGNTASALLSAARVVDGALTGPANDTARSLVASGPWSSSVVVLPVGWRRRSCCLFYRAPGGGLCGDCSLDSPPRRA